MLGSFFLNSVHLTTDNSTYSQLPTGLSWLSPKSRNHPNWLKLKHFFSTLRLHLAPWKASAGICGRQLLCSALLSMDTLWNSIQKWLAGDFVLTIVLSLNERPVEQLSQEIRWYKEDLSTNTMFKTFLWCPVCQKQSDSKVQVANESPGTCDCPVKWSSL